LLRTAWLVVASAVLVLAAVHAGCELAAAGSAREMIDVGMLGAALICFGLNLLLALLAWMLLCGALFVENTSASLVQVFALSLPGKYLPGGIWQPAARLKLLIESGGDGAIGAGAIAAEQMLALASLGLLSFSLFALGVADPSQLQLQLQSRFTTTQWLGGILLFALLLVVVGVSRWRSTLRSAIGAVMRVARSSKFAVAFLVTLTSQLAFAWGYLLLMPQDLRADSQGVAYVLFVVLAGTLVGFLTPIAPGGIGVREAAIVAGLGLGDASAPVTLAAVLARVLTVATEFALFGWALLRNR
jgi:hypothetical protein